MPVRGRAASTGSVRFALLRRSDRRVWFVLTGQVADGGGLLAGAIQQALGEPIQLPGLNLIITCSIGIATNGDNPSAEAMLRDADTALYQAKAAGRNRWVAFEASMRATLGARVETEAALRYAITHGQLWVAYQPMVDPTIEQTSERRSPDPLDPSGPWIHLTRGVHPGGGGDRADQADRYLGDGGVTAAGGALAGRRGLAGKVLDVCERFGSSGARSRTSPADQRGLGSAPDPVEPADRGDHRSRF
jgi:hypothetical protein